ncbi:hypothetical protein HELRODRAFT_75102, partial [Helobdella robusta]|uniref:RNA helicase n=1 Tax=Helobdella robusta TaxID=6412 RepID=T1G207_HELRO
YPPAAAPSAQQTKEARKVLDVRDFTYTRQQWTGKSPKQFLNDWYRKRVPKGQVTYEKIDLGGGKWKCHLKRPPKEGGDVVVCPEIACTNLKDAEHLASVLLLYQLCSNKDLHLLLPPPYRDIWLEWQRNEREQVQNIKQEDKKPRDDFIEKFFSQLSKSSGGGVYASNKDGGDVKKNTDGGAEYGGDWENWTAEENDALDAEKLNKSHHHQPLNRNFSDLIKRSIDIKTKNETNKSYAILKKDRESLPVYNYRQKIIDTFRNYDVFIVAGETGSGKSTQVPQFILEELLSSSSSWSPSSPLPPTIICTEPRRISAVSLARRVCAEMGEVDGPGSFGSLCGYQIRSEVKRSRDTRLLFCTTGVLLRRLQEDLCVEDVGCVIVDEVHERDLNTDVLLIHLLEMLTSNKKRSKLKVVLMSATMDSDKFHKYFKGCSVVRVEGRSFPVQVLHLEDIIERTGYQLEIDSTYALPYEYLVQVNIWCVRACARSSLDPNQFSLRTRNMVTRLNCDVINVDLILETVRWLNGPKNNKNNNNNNDDGICGKEGAVLVFLPGMAAIEEVKDSMLSDPLFSDPDRFLVLPLHSILSSSDQSLAFNPAKYGIRKVILSTNIAETGVTIPDVVYVIDCGWEKQMRYLDSHRISQLRQIWISKASARQRQGRAGRVREGVCVRLYTSGQFDVMSQHSMPEIKRVPLQGLCLHVMKSYSEPPNGFLSKAIDPPDPQAINVAMSILREAGACEGLSLTPLGHHLARLPLDAKLGKMMVYAGVLGCLHEASILVACMTEKSPFISRLESSASSPSASDCQGKARFNSEDSDQLAVYTAVREWMEISKRTERKDYCRKYGLKMEVLQDIESTSRELRQLIRDSNLETNITDLCTDHPSLTKYLQPRTSLLQSKVTVTLLKAVLMAGLYPQIGRLQTVDRNFGGKKRGLGREVNLAGGIQAIIHPGSVNRKLDADGWIVYQDKVFKLSQQIALRDTTLVSSVAVLLFAGNIEVQHQQHLLTVESVEDLIAFKAPAKIGVLMKEMRFMLDDFLRRKLHDPKLSVAGLLMVLLLLLYSFCYCLCYYCHYYFCFHCCCSY